VELVVRLVMADARARLEGVARVCDRGPEGAVAGLPRAVVGARRRRRDRGHGEQA